MKKDLYSVYEVKEQGLLLSAQTGKPVTTWKSITRKLKELGLDKIGENWQVPKELLKDWNDHVRQAQKAREKIEEKDYNEIVKKRVNGAF